jgi:nucleoside-diphosphate-sugar epimerase
LAAVTPMRILLLGAGGFIGKSLAPHLENNHQVIRVIRGTNLEELFQENQTYDFIINCVSSKPGSDLSESNESNFEYPRKFLENVKTKHWIQLESYFQLQIPMGRRDPYTLDKQRFSEYLDSNMKKHSAPMVHHLFLPHVFGEGDRPERLISSAIIAMRNGRTLETSSGRQYLPILHKLDAVTGIALFLDKPTSVASCAPFWYGQVKELLAIISAVSINSRIAFGQKADSSDVNFPQVQFPSTVNNWLPKMQLSEFLEWVRVQSE